jgi:UDP-glucose 4-epimerase
VGAGSTVPGDILDHSAVATLVEGADVVFHLAAYVHRRPRSRAEAELCHAVNEGGTRRVLDACMRSPKQPFLVAVSSTSVYGSAPSPWRETSRCLPTSVYGTSKLAAERLVSDAADRGAIRACILRPSMFFGRGAPGNLRLLAKLSRARFVPVARKGFVRKSITHVSNVVHALALAGADRGESGALILNVSDDAPMTIREIVEALGAALHVQARPLPVRDEVFALLSRVPRIREVVAAYADDAVVETELIRSVLPFGIRTAALEAIRAGEF